MHIPSEGLRFKCTGCGGCCTGSPGYVYLSKTDLTRLAAHLRISEEECVRRYCRLVEGQIALTEMPGNYDCVFLQGKRCSVYEARPIQCRTFPWWIDNLRTPEEWLEAKQRCEGIDHPDAPLVPPHVIEEACALHLDNQTDVAPLF
jgi:Fe-S-cluster containining protein